MFKLKFIVNKQNMTPIKKIIYLIVCATIFVVMYCSYIEQTEKNNQLIAKIQTLTAERDSYQEALKKEQSIEKLPSAATTPTIAKNTSPELPHTSTTATITEGQQKTKIKFRNQQFLRQIEQHLAIPQTEHDELLKSLSAEAVSTEEERAEVLINVLGEERTAEYERLRAESQAKQETEELETKLFSLSRKLKLNPEQERFARETLIKMQTQFKPRYQTLQDYTEQAMIAHDAPATDGADNREQLRTLFNQMKQYMEQLKSSENEFLNEKLKETLTDEQLNQLAQLQAESAD
jgi:hypothetical protein